MTSAGGLVPAEAAAEHPVSLLLCGPAGGVLAGAAAAVANGWPDAVTFDMGGTSTDVCLVLGGRPEPAGDAGRRRVPGAVAVARRAHDRRRRRVDRPRRRRWRAGGRAAERRRRARAGVLRPRRHRAHGDRRRPRRRSHPRRRRAAGTRAGSTWPPRAPRSTRPVSPPRAWSRSSTRRWSRPCARVSVERGVDPRGLALVAFGGAGPLHACALAEALGMPAVIVPARAGVLSAVGHPRRAPPGRPGRVVAPIRSTTPTAERRRRARWATRGGRVTAWRRARRRCEVRLRLPLRGSEPRAAGASRSTRSRPSTSGATATPGRARRSR